MVASVGAFNALANPFGEAVGTMVLVSGAVWGVGHSAAQGLQEVVDDEQKDCRDKLEARIQYAATLINVHSQHLSQEKANETRLFLEGSRKKVTINKNVEKQTASCGGTVIFNCSPGNGDAPSRIKALRDEYEDLNHRIKEAEHEIKCNRREDSQRSHNMRLEFEVLDHSATVHPFGFIPRER